MMILKERDVTACNLDWDDDSCSAFLVCDCCLLLLVLIVTVDAEASQSHAWLMVAVVPAFVTTLCRKGT
jgi:hypothetical protein